jgi:type I restriction enzyme M protein
MSLIQQGIEQGLIKFDADLKNIHYNKINKKYRFTDPEEKIRAEAYLALIINYKYPVERIDLEVVVPRRTPSDLADIVVYTDAELKQPYIVVECKKPEVTEAEYRQGIEQGFGNANSVKAKYLWVTSGLKNDYYNVADFGSMERERNHIADIPRFGETKERDYKFTKGGVEGTELKIVEQSELTNIFKQAHDALWAGGKRNPSEAFDELDKVIFCKVWDERATRKDGEPYDFQVFSGESNEKLKERIDAIYEIGKKKDKEVFKDDIRLTSRELETVVGYLAEVNLEKTDLDSKGRAFETFMGNFFRGEFGQYFTPRPIVEFMIDVLPITAESHVLDTSCGSGGFLLYALDKVRSQAHQMSKEGYFKSGSKKEHDHWHDFAEKNLFGIEISEGIARTAKMNMILHDDGHTNVISMDGLESAEKMRSVTDNKGFKENNFNFIVTNPPFGSSIKYAENRYVENYELGIKDVDWIEAKLKNINLLEKNPRDRQSSEILFLEQCHRFLKDDGILSVVIPDGVLTNSSLQYVRDWVEEKFRIIAVVSMPAIAFTATGAGVKSSVLFVKKYSETTTTAIREAKARIKDQSFEQPEFGARIISLEDEKKKALVKGNAHIQQMESDLVNHFNSLTQQGSLTKEIKKDLEAKLKTDRKAYEATDEYKEWRKETTEEYNERINNVKEALQEDYQEQVKRQTSNYPIFMAIAEDIGYDATGKATTTNELKAIATELIRFIEAVNKRTDSFFSLALQ